MATLIELQAQLEKLKRVRASGVSSVRNDNAQVMYRTDAELQAAIADLERQIATAAGSRSIRTLRVRTRDGW